MSDYMGIIREIVTEYNSYESLGIYDDNYEYDCKKIEAWKKDMDLFLPISKVGKVIKDDIINTLYNKNINSNLYYITDFTRNSFHSMREIVRELEKFLKDYPNISEEIKYIFSNIINSYTISNIDTDDSDIEWLLYYYSKEELLKEYNKEHNITCQK